MSLLADNRGIAVVRVLFWIHVAWTKECFCEHVRDCDRQGGGKEMYIVCAENKQHVSCM